MQLQFNMKLPQPDPFTERERQVLRLLVEGQTNIEIGKSLFLSEKTVKAHLQSMSFKLGTRNRTHLVVTALREGFVPLFPPEEEVSA